MKKLLLLLAVFALVISHAEAQNSYKIEGNVVGLPDGELVLVAQQETGVGIVGRTQVNAGKFVFTGQVDGVCWACVQTAQKEVVAELMLENADFGVLSGGVVTGGGEAQKLLARFDMLTVELQNKRQSLQDDYVEAEKKRDKKKMQEIDLQFQQFLTDVQAREVKLLQENADTYVAAYVVASTMRDIDLPQLEERYGLLGEKAKATFFGKAVEEQIERYRQVEVNGVAPDFKLPGAAGGVVGLYNTKAKAKVVYFWGSWDQTSRNLNVELLRLYQQYHPQGLEIVGVSLDTDAQAWSRAIGEDGVTWQSCCDLKGEASEVVAQYCIRSVPVLFLLDADNNIVAKNLYGSDLRKRLVDILKEK